MDRMDQDLAVLTLPADASAERAMICSGVPWFHLAA
jgi:hypothetical protein